MVCTVGHRFLQLDHRFPSLQDGVQAGSESKKSKASARYYRCQSQASTFLDQNRKTAPSVFFRKKVVMPISPLSCYSLWTTQGGNIQNLSPGWFGWLPSFSSSACCVAFATSTGKTFRCYLNRSRIEISWWKQIPFPSNCREVESSEVKSPFGIPTNFTSFSFIFPIIPSLSHHYPIIIPSLEIER